MLESVHKSLIKSSSLYRDWSNAPLSRVNNSLILMVYMVGVLYVTFISTTGYQGFSTANTVEQKKQVLGAAVSEVSDFVRIKNVSEYGESGIIITVSTPVITTAWIEYYDNVDKDENKIDLSSEGKFHVAVIENLEPGVEYVYRVGTLDSAGMTNYSSYNTFSLQK